jgi:RNA polymerase sigma-32 factor
MPTLDADRERALAKRFRGGDRRAGEILVQASLPFVVKIAHEYRRWGTPMEDIIQQGNIGLLKAAARFDPDRKCRLITYAAYWIRAEIREYVVRGYRMVRIGSTKNERRALRLYRTTREGDARALAEASGMTYERAERLLPVLTAHDVSLDQARPDTQVTPLERMASNDPSPEDLACAHDLRDRARSAVDGLLRELTPRERLIARSRWLRDAPITLEALGVKLGVSKERVRQLEDRIAGKLKARLEMLDCA